MSAYSATYLAELNIVPFDFGQNESSGALPWKPAAKRGHDELVPEPIEQVIAEEPEAVDDWAAREAEFEIQKEDAFERGRIQAQEEAELQIADTSLRLAQSVERLNAVVADLRARFRNEAVQLASSLAKAAIGEAESTQPEAIHQLIDNALVALPDVSEVKILCHPTDVEIIEQHIPKVENQRVTPLVVRVCADDSVERGGCVIHHAQGSIDAQPSVTVDILTEAVSSELATGSTNSVEESL